MTEQRDYSAWWENHSGPKILAETITHPGVVLRQILVACDIAQAPIGSDQETFPTLLPSEAREIVK